MKKRWLLFYSGLSVALMALWLFMHPFRFLETLQSNKTWPAGLDWGIQYIAPYFWLVILLLSLCITWLVDTTTSLITPTVHTTGQVIKKGIHKDASKRSGRATLYYYHITDTENVPHFLVSANQMHYLLQEGNRVSFSYKGKKLIHMTFEAFE